MNICATSQVDYDWMTETQVVKFYSKDFCYMNDTDKMQYLKALKKETSKCLKEFHDFLIINTV